MGLCCRILVLVLLSIYKSAVSQSNSRQTLEQRCDFVCNHPDCSDEMDCGYSGEGFECNFEDLSMCGWTIKLLDQAYTWERRQRGDALPDSGPSSDFTTGTATGWFVGVKSVQSASPQTAMLTSPEMRESSATCRMHLRYFLWDAGHTGLGATPLWASLWRDDGLQAVLWRPENSSVRGWREATVFLGRVPGPFQVRLQSQRAEGRHGDVAIDQLRFLDCALPLPVAEEDCGAGLKCKRGGCVEQWQVCDATDDCGDGSDEEDCEGYWRCDFDDGLCDWELTPLSLLQWVRTSQSSISSTDPWKGPGRDHSNNTLAGHFLYVTVPEGGLKNDWASFHSPYLEPTNSTHPCKIVMYTHQFGPRAGGLSVLVADRVIYPVWERGGALGDLWVKAEVEIVSNTSFFILFVAAIRDKAYGGIAIDSITRSPECRISKDNVTYIENVPKGPGHPCTEALKLCDFNPDCESAEDEAACGDFSYATGSFGWTDSSIGSQGWALNKGANDTTEDDYLIVKSAPGQQLTEAQTRTPLLGPSGPACTLNFSFALTGAPEHIGQLSVRVIDSVLGLQPRLWEFSERTGAEEEWRQAEVHVGVRDHRFQLVFEAHVRKLSPSASIKVKDVRYFNCHAEYFPSSPTDVSCNFEEGLCGWYQDNTDNFDWAVESGMDHTIGIGQSLVVDVWSPSLRGLFGRLLSFHQRPISKEHCLSFYYKLHGPETGMLNVKLLDEHGAEILLWTRRGSHGNMWHEGQCPVPHQLTSFQLIFEAVRSGFDGRVAIDDVTFMSRSCAVDRKCSFEGQQCGYTSSGATRWLHRTGQNTQTGPNTDHTLETEMGYYMMADTDVEVLPLGSVATLTSPVRQGVDHNECVNFWYHMGGEKPGTLNVYKKPATGERVKIFSNGLGQGEVWRHGNCNISSALVDWQLEFEVQGAGGKSTHVAIDDILYSTHPCSNKGTKCDLERGLCGWSNTQNPKVDMLDWELSSAEAETTYPTPPYDHTLGTERGHFLYLPSSLRDTANFYAKLLSPHLPPTKGTCLRFWAHRPTSADGKLTVWRLAGEQLLQLLVIEEVETVWKRFNVEVNSSEEYQIVFEGVKGTAGVLAMDDIEYSLGYNCAGEATDPLTTPSQPDSAGGIAASIILTLLLISIIAGLLVYYLRLRERAKATSTGPFSPASESFSNSMYDPKLTEDHVTVSSRQSHPMAVGFNFRGSSEEGVVEMKES